MYEHINPETKDYKYYFYENYLEKIIYFGYVFVTNMKQNLKDLTCNRKENKYLALTKFI